MNEIKRASNQLAAHTLAAENLASELIDNVQVFDLIDMAIAFHKNGMLEEAGLIYRKILIKDPGHADSMNLLGLIALQKKEYPQAIELINKAILLSKENKVHEFHANLGVVLHKEGLLDESIASFDLAIALNSECALYYKKRGIAQLEKKYFDAAIDSFDRAITLNSLDAMDFLNRGIAQLEKKYLDAAIDSFDQAIILRPNFPEAFNNRGLAQLEKKYFDDAIDSFEQAIKLSPNYTKALWNKGLLLLKLEKFEEGWPLYETRLKDGLTFPLIKQKLQKKFTCLEELNGKSILLYSEQGIGDTIQFYRYVKKISHINSRLTVAVQDSLVDLLTNEKPLWNVVSIEGALPEFDFSSPLMSIPFILGEKSIGDIVDKPYIYSNPLKVSEWKSRLGPKTRPRVGLVWSGNALFKNNANRSIPLLQMISFLPADLEYVSIQKELNEFDLKALERNRNILHFEKNLVSYDETAALLECLDLVLTVDTSVAHLAGAMGKRAWLLLSANADWRWFVNKNSSPWYPTIRLFRQEKAGDWSSVLKLIENELKTQLR